MREEKEEKVTKQQYLMLTLEKKTHKPNMDTCAIFPTHKEALKAKGFMRGSGMVVLLLPIGSYKSKEEFCEVWRGVAKKDMLATLGM